MSRPWINDAPTHQHGRRRRPAMLAVAAVLTAGVALTATPSLASPAAAAVTGTAGFRAAGQLRASLEPLVAAGVPGAIVRVQQGEHVELATAGVSDLPTAAPMRPDARFRVGSITKTFVATVVLQLVGQRRLVLDQPVGRWLPGLLADGRTITVRELLNHTSGLFDYTSDPTVLAGIAVNRVFQPAELVAIAESHPRSFAPGAAWRYSSTNYIVLGLLVQAVTRHSLGYELQRRIFTPLGLRDTTFPTSNGQIADFHAHGYVPTELIPTPDGQPLDVTTLNPSGAWAAGGIISNAADLSHFYRALLGGRLLSPRLLAQMKTTVREDPADPTFGYGLGIEEVQNTCGTLWGHRGAIFGYQDTAYWNQQTHRMVVLAATMYPTPIAAQAPLASAVDYALCGKLAALGADHGRVGPDHGRALAPTPTPTHQPRRTGPEPVGTERHSR